MNETEVSRVAEALAQSFRDTVARVSGDSWEETGVTLPSKEVFERYARVAIRAMDRRVRPIITIGFDKNGELDFSIPVHELENIGVQRMKEVRSMLMVGYCELEGHWRTFGPPSKEMAASQPPQAPK